MESVEKKGLGSICVMPRMPQKRQFEREVTVMSNHYKIEVKTPKNCQVFLYKLKISPEIGHENRELKRQIMDQVHKEVEERLGKYYMTGWVVFALQQQDGVNLFSTKVAKQMYDVDLAAIKNRKDNKTKSLNLKGDESNKQFLNSILKKLMLQLDYKDIGILSKYFDVKNPCQVSNADLQVYRGFYTSIDIYSNQVPLVLVDVSTRVLQSKSCLQFMKTLKSKSEIEDMLIGNSVIVQYGNYRTYVIDDIIHKLTPNSTFNCKGKMKSYKEYYKQMYNITIKENAQPLLLSIRRQKDSEGKLVEVECYLVPELVKVTGMTDRERNNFKTMQEVAKFTKLFPNQRMEEQNKLVENLKQQLALTKQSPLSIGEQMSVQAQVYANPTIHLRKSVKPNNGDFKNSMRAPVLQPVDIPSYLLVYYEKDYSTAEELEVNLKSCASAYSIRVGQCEYSEMTDTNAKNWASYLEEDFKHFNTGNKLRVVVVLLPFQGGDQIYKAIKDVCYNRLNVLSQCVKGRTLQKNTKSVCSNLLLQINAKLNGTLWKVERPLDLPKNVMLIGVDVHHGGVGRKKHSIIGFAATMDDDFSKYYCRIQKQDRKDQEIIYKGVATQVVDCVHHYFSVNKKFPETIIYYRDGVGDSMFDMVTNIEIPQINDGIEALQKKLGSSYKPKFAEFIVTKQIKDRFFLGGGGNQGIRQQGRGGRGGGYQKTEGSGLTNCESGTIVNSTVVSGNANRFEFFMVAQNVTQGTCTPTRYIQLANNTTLNQEQFFQLTYNQCFNFYNWPGAVKVPAVVQYASNVAKFVGQTFIQNPIKQEPIHLAKALHLYHL